MDNSSFLVLCGAMLVFFGAIVAYVLFMFFLPEWVGITGKVALDAERAHREGSEASNDDLMSRL